MNIFQFRDLRAPTRPLFLQAPSAEPQAGKLRWTSGRFRGRAGGLALAWGSRRATASAVPQGSRGHLLGGTPPPTLARRSGKILGKTEGRPQKAAVAWDGGCVAGQVWSGGRSTSWSAKQKGWRIRANTYANQVRLGEAL